eukprot:TRINITY_DN9838_c0_g1_i1.p1 TRINITY_DN9838_c0_g1~~TRINITY_DN9838_c0_g1_i1.p1  ORF type:complete len:172 (-),score=21.08 TRINITY_DN9838_c0_g1_i1:227-742(-)
MSGVLESVWGAFQNIGEVARQAGLPNCCSFKSPKAVDGGGISRQTAADDKLDPTESDAPNVSETNAGRQAESGMSLVEKPRHLSNDKLVRIVGLKGATHLNGLLGKVVGFKEGGRVLVSLVPPVEAGDIISEPRPSGIKLVRPENLEDVRVPTSSNVAPCEDTSDSFCEEP